jgi:internalin A
MGTINQEITAYRYSQMKNSWIIAIAIGLLSLIVSCTPESVQTKPEKPQLLTKSFTQWCKEKENLPPTTQSIIDLLLVEADTKDCELANTKLLKLTQLDLYHNNISNLEPLASLKNLTSLDLIGNQISDVTPLAELSNLTYLALSENMISDVKPLANLTKLTYLSLNHNLISDIKPLVNLSNLTDLTLIDNKIVDKSTCPMAERNCSF